MMRTCRVVRALTFVGAFTMFVGVASPASAQSKTANLTVGATVVKNCLITTTAVTFPNYDPVDANALTNLDGEGHVLLACTKQSTPSIDLDLGANSTGTQRRLTAGGADRLNYELFSNSGRSTVWDTFTPPAAPNKNQRDFTVYARIASGQDVAAGAYADTIQATVNF